LLAIQEGLFFLELGSK